MFTACTKRGDEQRQRKTGKKKQSSEEQKQREKGNSWESLRRFLASKASKKNVTMDPIFVFNNQLPLPRSAIPLSLGTFLPSSLSLLRYSLPNHPTPLYSSPQASPIRQQLSPTLRRRATQQQPRTQHRSATSNASSGRHRPPFPTPPPL